MNKTLWLLDCWDGSVIRLFLLYAEDERDAERQVQLKLEAIPELCRRNLRSCPQGFLLNYEGRPGQRNV